MSKKFILISGYCGFPFLTWNSKRNILRLYIFLKADKYAENQTESLNNDYYYYILVIHVIVKYFKILIVPIWFLKESQHKTVMYVSLCNVFPKVGIAWKKKEEYVSIS